MIQWKSRTVGLFALTLIVGLVKLFGQAADFLLIEEV